MVGYRVRAERFANAIIPAIDRIRLSLRPGLIAGTHQPAAFVVEGGRQARDPGSEIIRVAI